MDPPRLWVRLRFVRIDPAREDRLQPRIDARSAERLLHERVEAEGRQVPFVEHDRMAQLDRLLVVDVGLEQIEQRPRARAVAPVPGDGGPAIQHLPIVSDPGPPCRCDLELQNCKPAI